MAERGDYCAPISTSTRSQTNYSTMSFLSNELQTTGPLLLTPGISVHFREVGDELGQITGPDWGDTTEGFFFRVGQTCEERVLRE